MAWSFRSSASAIRAGRLVGVLERLHERLFARSPQAGMLMVWRAIRRSCTWGRTSPPASPSTGVSRRRHPERREVRSRSPDAGPPEAGRTCRQANDHSLAGPASRIAWNEKFDARGRTAFGSAPRRARSRRREPARTNELSRGHLLYAGGPFGTRRKPIRRGRCSPDHPLHRAEGRPASPPGCRALRVMPRAWS